MGGADGERPQLFGEAGAQLRPRRRAEPGLLRAEPLPAEQSVTFAAGPHLGAWTEYFTGSSLTVDADTIMTVEPWGYRVFVG